MKLALNDKETVGINNTEHRCRRYIDIVAESNQDLQYLTTAIHETSKKLGLKINTEKTKSNGKKQR